MMRKVTQRRCDYREWHERNPELYELKRLKFGQNSIILSEELTLLNEGTFNMSRIYVRSFNVPLCMHFE